MTPPEQTPARVRPLLVLVSLPILGFWLFAKTALLRHLDYIGDLFSFLQMSRSFAQGRPLLFENAFGNGAALHNWYLVPLFFPLTSWLGARGLFVGLLVLWGLAVAAVDQLRRERLQSGSGYAAIAVALLLGPVAFWLVDDLPYGFNVELVFCPLAVLFAASLARGSRAAWLWGALIVPTREDGPVLAWAIQALAVFLRAPRSPGGNARGRWLALARVTALWLAVFAAEIAWLLHETPAGRPSRVGASLDALRHLFSTPDAARSLGTSFLDAALLLAAGVLAVALWVPARAALAGAVAAVPLLLALAVASQLYGGIGILARGPSWAPRFAFLWGYLAAVSVLGVACSAAGERSPRRAVVPALAVALSLAAQYGALSWRLSYSVANRLSWRTLARGKGLFASSLGAGERAFLDCLAERIPRATVVQTNLSLFAIFERQDLVWPDHPRENTWTGVYAQLMVCDIAGRAGPDRCLDWQRELPETGFERTRVDGLQIAYGRTVAGIVEACAPSR